MPTVWAIIIGVILVVIVVGANLFRLWDGNQMYLRKKAKQPTGQQKSEPDRTMPSDLK